MEKLFIFAVDDVLLDTVASMRSFFSIYYSISLNDYEWQNALTDIIKYPKKYQDFIEYYTHTKAYTYPAPFSGMYNFISKLKQQGFATFAIGMCHPDISSERTLHLQECYPSVFNFISICNSAAHPKPVVHNIIREYQQTYLLDVNPQLLRFYSDVVTHPIWKENSTYRFMYDELPTTNIKKVGNIFELQQLISKLSSTNLFY